MLSISVTVHGEVYARLDGIPKKLRGAFEEKFRAGVEEIYHKSIRRLSKDKYSSTPEVSFGVDAQGSALIGFIEPLTEKTQVQEFGGRSYYEILPLKGKALRFIGRTGDVVYAKRVFHPPARGKHYIRDTIGDELPHLRAALEEALRDTPL